MQFTGPYQFQRTTYGLWQPGNNTGKNDNGYTITDATFGHLLTQPHQKHGAGNQGYRSGKDKARARVHYQ